MARKFLVFKVASIRYVGFYVGESKDVRLLAVVQILDLS
jgi:hypothetical protein